MYYHYQEEKQRKLLRVRLEMAKFLQETVRESGLKANAHIIGSDAFKEFFRKVRGKGHGLCSESNTNSGSVNRRVTVYIGYRQRRSTV